MKNSSKTIFFSVLFLLLFLSITHAKIPDQFKQAFEVKFTPAVPHQGLVTAAEPLEMDKIKTFVVVEKDRVIPADRAAYFIGPGEYDYRGAVVSKDSVKTRPGKPYIYLSKGTVMAVAGVVFSGTHVYLKLISTDKIHSATRPKLKPTRVTVMLGFEFDKSVFDGLEMAPVFNRVEGWVKPFASYEEAVRYLDIGKLVVRKIPPQGGGTSKRGGFK